MKFSLSLLPLLALQPTLLAASAGFGKSTYAMHSPIAWSTWITKYLPAMNLTDFPVNSTDLCVEWAKMCIDDGGLTTCDGVSGNFQLHAVGAYNRDSGTMTMEEIEAMYGSALGDMNKYDPFMENNVAFYTRNLDRVQLLNLAFIPLSLMHTPLIEEHEPPRAPSPAFTLTSP